MRSAGTAVVIALVAVVGSRAAVADTWPQWRGPGRSGVLPAAQAPRVWPEALKQGWRVDVGEGYSSPVVADGRVFVHARRDPDEVVMALDLSSGTVAWQQTYPAPFTKNPYAKSMTKGPYSTPLVSDGRLFTLGTSGILSAWNTKSGALLWRKDFSAGIDTSKLFCGTAMSPLSTNRGVVVQVGDDRGGSVATFDPATGAEVWSRRTDGPGYASPIETTIQGTPQIVTMTTRSVIGLASDTGEPLWEFPFDDEWNENIVTPIAHGSGVIVSGVRQGTRRLAIEKDGGAWRASVAWHVPEVTMYMSSPVLAGDVLYGHSSKRRGQFVALDPGDGRTRWATEGRDGTSAAVVAAGDHLLFLTTDSQLVVAARDADRFREVRRYTVADSAVYAHPAILPDRIVVRDASHVAAWTLE